MTQIIFIIDNGHIQDIITSENFTGEVFIIYRDDCMSNFEGWDMSVEKDDNEVKRLLKKYKK